jgi:uncharacterized alkaline shock family protein YloU
MSTPTPTAPKTTTPAPTGSALTSTQGKTTIADGVVAKVAGLAAREVSGVHGFGGTAARAFGAITERIPGSRSSASQGVSVEVGERQAAVDLTIVVEYGVAISEVSRAIRRNVIGSVEQMTGLEVTEVNVDVVDLHLPDEEDDAPAPAPAPARVR